MTALADEDERRPAALCRVLALAVEAAGERADLDGAGWEDAAVMPPDWYTGLQNQSPQNPHNPQNGS